MIRNEDKIKGAALNARNDPRILHLDAIRELGVDEKGLNDSGFVFYTGDEERA